MPAPTSASEFVHLVLKSGVVEEERVRKYLKNLAESGTGIPPEPARLAGLMVHDGLLTYFQAEQILQGKYKRFMLGKYKVLEKLGSGGMGQVFLCEHTLMRRRVAIKVLPTSKAQDPAGLERFYREARAIAAVDHPNLVRAYDIDQADNLHFLVMEYVDGISLQDLVAKIGPLPVLRACHYIYGAAVGLKHVHQIGLVHRDIKPGNILVDRHGMVKILDLGLARFFHDNDELTRKYDENILGTADYLSPEQAVDSHTVDIRADIYSLGATFYFLLTGQPPFPEGTVTQKLIWHQTKEPKPITAFRSDVPPEIIAIINKMMKKDPEQRYQTPAELMQDLAPFVTVPIPPPSEQELPVLSRAATSSYRPSPGPITSLIPKPSTAPEIDANPSVSPVQPPISLGAATVAEEQTSPPVTVGPTSPPIPIASNTSATGTSPSIPEGYSLKQEYASEPAAFNALAATPLLAADESLTESDPSGAVWDNLASETSPIATAKTSAKGSLSPRLRATRRTRITDSSSRYRIFGIVLLVLVVLGVTAGLAAILLLPLFNGTQQQEHRNKNVTASSAPRTWIVAPSGGTNTAKTLREALARAGPGDTILIRKQKISEPTIRLEREQHKNLTIRGDLSPDDGLPVWEAASRGIAMLELIGTEGVRIQNITLDGADQVGNAVLLSSYIPGVVVENVVIQRCSLAAIHCQNVAGTAERPVVLHQIRLLLNQPSQIGVHLAAINVDNQHIHVTDMRVEGSNSAVGVRI
ncbi:MAG: protein kinase, partial [Thermogemmata sp.]|nr:protein kinase [Thermogemmata sp.]